MNEQEYLSERIEDQIEWYSKSSQFNKRWYYALKLTAIISAAIIPFLTGMSNKVSHSNFIIGILGIAIAVSAAASVLFKFHENWIQYRTTAEQLKHEKCLYQTKTKPYSEDKVLNLLVERIENIISKENSQWADITKKKDEGETKQ